MAPSPATAGDRPEVIVNCAVSADGRLAYAGGRRARLSGPEDLRRVQRLRATSGAIVVGVGTVVLDDPSLRVHWELLDGPPGAPPLRVVLDSRGRTPQSARVLDVSLPTLVAVTAGNRRAFPPHVAVFSTPGERVDLVRLLGELRRRGISRVMVEGGAQVIAAFLRDRLVDRLTVYVAPVLIGGSTAPPMMAGPETRDEASAVPLRLAASERMDDGLLLSYVPRAPPPASTEPGAHAAQ